MKIISRDKISRERFSSDTVMESVISDQPPKIAEPFLLRQLPLEIRRQIYKYYLFATRHPSPKVIYLEEAPHGSRDPPSPLLSVSSQVRAEVLDLIQKWPIFLRVTRRGIRFGSMAETCFIAQQCSRDYGKISHLVVEIWPPHPDRPTDAIDTWRHLRRLRAELRAGPPPKRISFLFADNEMASWTVDGKALNFLKFMDVYRKAQDPLWCNDVTYIMALFARVSAPKAHFHRPHGLKPGDSTESVLCRLREVNAMMMGMISTVDAGYFAAGYDDKDKDEVQFQDDSDEMEERRLRIEGAEIAHDKLDVMTQQGDWPLTKGQWKDFIAVWSPHFDQLYRKTWKGKVHYVY